jgi:hypothetical protein
MEEHYLEWKQDRDMSRGWSRDNFELTGTKEALAWDIGIATQYIDGRRIDGRHD